MALKKSEKKSRKDRPKVLFLTQTPTFKEVKKLKVENAVFIPGDVISSKNSKVNIRIKNSKFNPSIMSPAATRYLKVSKNDWENMAMVFRHKVRLLQDSFPLFLQFIFVRQEKRLFDYHNMVQFPVDIMQKFGWINDDDISQIIIIPYHTVFLNREKPGMYIKVLTKEEIEIFKIIGDVQYDE